MKPGHSFKNRSGDEWYTQQETVLKFKKDFNLAGKKIYLPFDTKDSEFYKVLKDDNEVMLKQYDNFFMTPDSFLENYTKTVGSYLLTHHLVYLVI